jgi:hypothetical protein
MAKITNTVPINTTSSMYVTMSDNPLLVLFEYVTTPHLIIGLFVEILVIMYYKAGFIGLKEQKQVLSG